MHPALEERFGPVDDLNTERYGDAKEVLRVHYRIARTGRWKSEHHSFDRGVARMKQLALDPKVDRSWSETVPNPISEIPEFLGGGTVDLSKPMGCPECGSHDECESFCDLARFGR